MHFHYFEYLSLLCTSHFSGRLFMFSNCFSATEIWETCLAYPNYDRKKLNALSILLLPVIYQTLYLEESKREELLSNVNNSTKETYLINSTLWVLLFHYP